MESLTKVQSLRKTGAGALRIGSHDSLSGLTVQSGSLSLAGGQNAASLQLLTMAANTQLSGLSGTLSNTQTQLNLTMAPQNIGENTAATPMLSGADLALVLPTADNLTLDLSADAVVELLEAHRDAGVSLGLHSPMVRCNLMPVRQMPLCRACFPMVYG